MVDKLRGTPKENQPEYRWSIETDKHLLRVTHIGKDGKRFNSSDSEYTPTPNHYPQDIEVLLLSEDVKLEVVPYHLQVYKNNASLKLTSGDIMDDLFVGIVDKKSVGSLGSIWTTAEGQKGMNQYFFESNDMPASFRSTFIYSPSWPLNRPPFVLPDMRPYFSALAEITPDASKSLATCTEILSRPGAEYTPNNTYMTFQLPRRMK